MSNRARGRPTRNTAALNVRVSNAVLSELRSCRPDLLKPGSTQFRHGALGSWLENILWKELRGKPKYAAGQAISRSLGGEQPGETVPGGSFSGSSFSSYEPLGRWGSATENGLGSTGASSENAGGIKGDSKS